MYLWVVTALGRAWSVWDAADTAVTVVGYGAEIHVRFLCSPNRLGCGDTVDGCGGAFLRGTRRRFVADRSGCFSLGRC